MFSVASAGSPVFTIHSGIMLILPRANPTMTSYNASAVKNYNGTGSLVRFENKNSFVGF
jgi:hypothetical protein